jgi:hypothetical protein
MSHTTTLRGVQITNPTAIQRAVADLVSQGIQIELLENATPRMYYKRQENEIGKCDYVLKIANSRYDVGLKWNAKEKQYDAIMDTWAGEVAGQIGATCPAPRDAGKQGEHAIGKFTQRYLLHAAKISAMNEGYSVIGENIGDDGAIQLELAVDNYA